MEITSPADGASVDSAFEVTWDASEQLGEPETGRHHVHVFVDGQSEDYTVVGGNSFTIEGLTPGQHTVNVTLQHADHSPAGAEDSVEVDVAAAGGSGGSTGSPSPEEESPSSEESEPTFDY